MHPEHFRVNEAWIAFQLNGAPIHTEQDGSFDVICLMDAASCYILGNVFIPVGASEPSEVDATRLLKEGWSHKKQYPTTLFVPRGQFTTGLTVAAERHHISVEAVPESQLTVFVRDAREGFQDHFQAQRGEA